MSNSRPQDLQEWADYISSLSRTELLEKTVAANTMSFVRDLKHEGYRLDTIETIFILLAQALQRQHVLMPTNGVYDLESLVAKRVSVRGNPARYKAGPDDLDLALERLS